MLLIVAGVVVGVGLSCDDCLVFADDFFGVGVDLTVKEDGGGEVADAVGGARDWGVQVGFALGGGGWWGEWWGVRVGLFVVDYAEASLNDAASFLNKLCTVVVH